ncbi:cilia- and flagella-associated protein 157-like [Clinocottus analis]|uniref:cilia- and flagella-associated protein 157-like n=1 Tax=Clinocottus analis TaxID=304258 RepID=UPI0035C25EF6
MAASSSADVSERSICLTQIRYLEEQLDSCQQRCDGLEARNVELSAQRDALEKHKHESIEHLKRLLAGRDRRQAEQLRAERKEHGLRLRGLRRQHGQSMQELQQRQDDLLAEGQALEAALLEQQQQKVLRAEKIQEKLDMETRMSRLVQSIKELEVSIDDLQNAAQSERENQLAARKRKIERRVAHIIGKDRAEDAECLERLNFLQKKNATLPGEVEALRVQNGVLRLQKDEVNADMKRLAREGLTCQEAVKKTKMECQEMKAELEIRSSSLKSVQDETAALRRLVATACDESRQEAAEAARLRAEIQREHRSRRARDGVQREGVLLLTHILKEEEEATETERKLQRLQEILQSSAPHDTV